MKTSKNWPGRGRESNIYFYLAISYITNILNNMGMSNIWIKQFENQNKITNKINTNYILTRLTDIFSQTSVDTIQNTNNSKLHFLNYFKKVFNTENYLKIRNFENRRALTKLRTSSHNLYHRNRPMVKKQNERIDYVNNVERTK